MNRPGERAKSRSRARVTLGVALKSLVMLVVLAAAVIVARPAEAKAAGAKRNIVVPVTVMVNLSSRTIRPSDDEVVERVRQASDLWMRVSAGRVSLELVQIIELKIGAKAVKTSPAARAATTLSLIPARVLRVS